jgi:hypothetical protein
MKNYKNAHGLSSVLNSAYTLVIFLVLVKLLGTSLFGDIVIALISIGVAYFLADFTLKSMHTTEKKS